MLSPKSIIVSWKPILFTEVTGYVVSYTSFVRYARDDNVTVSGANVSHIAIEKLQEYTNYSITVQSVTNNTVSDASGVVSVRTWSDGKGINFVRESVFCITAYVSISPLMAVFLVSRQSLLPHTHTILPVAPPNWSYYMAKSKLW